MTIRSYLGLDPVIHDSAYIDSAATVIGQVSINADSSLWPMVVARGDVNHIEIGKRTSIQDGTVLHVTHDGPYTPGGLPLLIGDDVTVGHNVTLHACIVHSACLIGMGAVVLDGAEIASETIIGAASLVPPGKQLEGGYLWLGSPVKRIRPLTREEKESIRYSAAHYVRLANNHKGSREETADDILPETHE